MTDLLGVMEAWDDTTTRIRDEAGVLTEIARSDIVSGKPVPPRPSPRLRVHPEVACRRSNASWPAVRSEPLGEWLLRASGGFSARANSVMAVGDPGRSLDEALAAVVRFYDAHNLVPWAQVIAGSPTCDALEAAGWGLARPGEADTEFQIGSVAQAARVVRRRRPGDAPEVSVSADLDEAWLANETRALAHHDDAVAVLAGPARVGFVSVGGPDRPDARPIAKGRVAADGDWAGITDVWVSPDHRRRGLGLVVMDALLDWAGEHGATTAYLQVRGDNPPALAMYEALGFRTHHAYRYLAAPDRRVVNETTATSTSPRPATSSA